MKVLIVDDHPLMRKGMSDLILLHHPDWELYEAENGVQAILRAAELRPDIILMDYIMPKLDGVRAASSITHDLPGSKIIMLTMSDPDELLMSSIEAGIRCIVPKDAPVEVILETISDISNGNIQVRPGHPKAVPDKRKEKRGRKSDTYSRSTFLTDRELEVIGLMIKGYTPKKMAEYLGISARTVEFHKYKILKKCNAHSSSEVIHYILSNKILPF